MEKIQLAQNEALVVIVRHPNHVNNVISEVEAERVVKQGRRLRALGLLAQMVVAVVASIRVRSQKTAELLLEGLGTSLPIIVSKAYDALDEIGEQAKEFKTVAVAQGMKPWQVLAENRGTELCKQFGIADRLVRATQFLSVCTVTAQFAGPGKAVVVSGHNGNGIEPALELAKAQARGERISSSADLSNPPRYVNEAGVVLLYVDTTTGLLSREPVYLDA